MAINHRPNVTKDPASTVVARNVPFVADEQQLLEWFGKVGTVVDMFRGLNDAGKLNRYGCGKRCGRRGVPQLLEGGELSSSCWSDSGRLGRLWTCSGA